MAIVRWDPSREIDSLQQEMNRLFGTYFDSPRGGGSARRQWIPAMDLVETKDEYVLRADLPGVSESDVNVELEQNVLTVSGARQTEQEEKSEGYYRVERATGSFSRSLTLPEGVAADRIQASFDRGVLEVRVGKPEQRKPQKVQIEVGDQRAAIEGTETRESEEVPA